MNDPIKIIYKYKNSNRRVQYNQYVFIGSIRSDATIKILKKIEEKDWFDTLIMLSQKEIKHINSVYGDYWYIKFFNSHHISFSINNVKRSKQKRNDLIKKYGKKLNTLVIFYMLVAIIIPSLGVAIFIVIASFLNLPVDLPVLLVGAFFIAILQFVFIALFKSVRPMVNL